MKLQALFNVFASRVKSIFILQFHVLKTIKKFENDKQLVEVNLSYDGCILLYVNGKRIPKVRKILVKPIEGKKVVTFRAIGFFQFKNIILNVEPNVALNTNLSKQISSASNIVLSNKKLLKPLYSNSLLNKIDSKLIVRSLDSNALKSGITNKKISQLESKSQDFMLKSNTITLTDILTKQS